MQPRVITREKLLDLILARLSGLYETIGFVIHRLASPYRCRMQDLEAIIHALQQRAKANLEQGRLNEAEQIYSVLLTKAEITYGTESLPVGLALMDLADCYEKQGNQKMFDKLYERIRKIMAIYAKKVKSPEND